MTTRLQHLNQTVEPLHHLQTAMVLDNERHLELWMLLQLEELPGVEVRYEITVMTQHYVPSCDTASLADYAEPARTTGNGSRESLRQVSPSPYSS